MFDRVSDCPFCGNADQALFAALEVDDDAFVVSCARCHCIGPTGASESAAVAAWNQRARPADHSDNLLSLPSRQSARRLG